MIGYLLLLLLLLAETVGYLFFCFVVGCRNSMFVMELAHSHKNSLVKVSFMMQGI